MALDNYDAIGQCWRKEPVSFAAFTQTMLTYALGRSVEATDRETVDGIVQQLKLNEYRIQSLLQARWAAKPFA